MALSQNFKDYARLSKYRKQYTAHKDVTVSEQPGVVGTYGGVTYATFPYATANVAASMSWPNMKDDLASPGKVGGPALDLNNALTIPGDVLPRPVPMGLTLTAPNLTQATIGPCTMVFTNLPSKYKQKVASLVWTISHSALKLEDTMVSAVTKEDGAAGFETAAGDMVEQWDGALVISYDLTLPNATTDTWTLNLDMHSSSPITGTYTLHLKAYDADKNQLFHAVEDDFTVVAAA